MAPVSSPHPLTSLLGNVVLLVSLIPTAAAACPDLKSFYPGPEPDWGLVENELEVIFDQCLESSEYFALLGGAQLNLGDVARSIESLERALLLNPDNGSALIDYGEALYRDGQLFAALEINTRLVEREDVPGNLQEQLIERQQYWQRQTRQTSWRLDFGGGYDNNLNGAPDDTQIAITLSGEPIYLNLNEEYRSVSGALLNAGFTAEHTRLFPDKQDNFLGRVRSRFSESESSDVVQATGRYSRLFSGRRFNYRQGLGISHLTFEGRELFTGTDIRQRVEFTRGSESFCDRFMGLALQHQLWHTQRRLDGAEVKAGVGAACNFTNLEAQAFGIELNLVHNRELRDDRLGGDRNGWQILGQWQWRSLGGLVTAQVEFASLRDEEGYSPLLENNSRRQVSRGSGLLQYQRPGRLLGLDTALLVNVFHQEQSSNIDLFDTTDTSIGLGISINF